MIYNLISNRRVNKELPVPFYYQIVQILREAIQDILESPERDNINFPSETELLDIFQVNRGTIRHAMDVLEREGYIYREKGRGTFLRKRRVELDLSALCSTTEDLKLRGWTPGTKLLKIDQVVPRPHVLHSLALPQESKVWELYRLRLADNEPISLQWSYIPISLAPDLDQHNLTESLYFCLKNIYHLDLRTAEQAIRIHLASSDEAELLEIPLGTSVFGISRTTFDINDKPIEYLDSIWRGDRYDLQVHLTARN